MSLSMKRNAAGVSPVKSGSLVSSFTSSIRGLTARWNASIARLYLERRARLARFHADVSQTMVGGGVGDSSISPATVAPL